MNNLLSANFSRLWKNKMFWIGAAFMAVLAIFICTSAYIEMVKYATPTQLDGRLFSFIVAIGVLAAAFCSLFLGAEYSDGTMRNKLVVGHGRVAIYLANLVTCTAAAILMCAAYLLTALALGIPMFGMPQLPWIQLLALLAASIMLTAAFTSVFTLVSMLTQNKAAAAVINLVLFIVILMLAVVINSKLEEPEVYDGYMYLDDSGTFTQEESMPNPNYVRGFERKLLEFLHNFLPGGQVIQISSVEVNQPLLEPLYSLFIAVLMAFVGIAVFRRKDIK